MSIIPEINSKWVREVSLLKSLGFVHCDSSGYFDGNDDIDNIPSFDVESGNAQIIMVEKEFSRNMLCVVLNDSDFDVYVQNDVGCGFTLLPYRWSELNREWLEALKISFFGHGFNVHQ